MTNPDISALRFPEELEDYLRGVLKDTHETQYQGSWKFSHYDDFPIVAGVPRVRVAITREGMYVFQTLEEIDQIKAAYAGEPDAIQYSWVKKSDLDKLLDIHRLVMKAREVERQAIIEGREEEESQRFANLPVLPPDRTLKDLGLRGSPLKRLQRLRGSKEQTTAYDVLRQNKERLLDIRVFGEKSLAVLGAVLTAHGYHIPGDGWPERALLPPEETPAQPTSPLEDADEELGALGHALKEVLKTQG
jgi:hypothetical protein